MESPAPSSAQSAAPTRPGLMARFGPGILVAATGVGAGDLLTASLGGSAVGVAILWAAVVGSVLKGFLNEGVARWQLATGTTLLEGWARLGPGLRNVFFIYLLGWSFFTGGALISACGAAGDALWPLGGDPETSRRIWGVIHSLVGLALVGLGGFRLFEKLMAACIALMFGAVLFTAVASQPDWAAAARGLVIPSLPDKSTVWVLGLLGGVGGTVTMLSYGYWIREKGREGPLGLKTCQADLTVGYALTGMFGAAMVIIGSTLRLEGTGLKVASLLASRLEAVIGPAGYWVFLAGFWGAVFSSLLGVWEGIPYLFADFLRIHRKGPPGPTVDLRTTRAWRLYLVALAIVPLPMLWAPLQRAQLAYAVVGALFMPLLAATLLWMNNRRAWVGSLRNGWLTNAALVATLLLFLGVGLQEALDALRKLQGP
ncbi:divalent metal cation transporter [Myxococcus llanfairpwllgwyngyllgogerychwyrndrobwllllantysiliogogogochensis]|uniref:Divalent metal cation transporter n=2 Tax=Myxococcus llanfairpwllgwyngyllgogerychwyrndrobwllllantysiliogogogochensis TaxID=2590453 RepID=A0A540WTJ7_9BACT|nr:divalent metal cation transporter [Myxococcus llanfairpwllgwyngyllgogerychwyrndrobwllllantysiliogogogochensis]